MRMNVSINDGNEDLLLHINGLYFFQGYQVVEAFTPCHTTCYYLFYYKNKFLTGKSTAKIKVSSTLHLILSKGIYVSSSNPISQFLLHQEAFSPLPKLSSLWKEIKKHYPTREAFHIMSAFDTYVHKKDLISFMKEAFLKQRRAGKLLHAYRILRIVLDKYPTNKWASSLISHMDYQKYSLKYQAEAEDLLPYDPLHMEFKLYHNRASKPYLELLDHKLQREERYLECLALYYEQLFLDASDTEKYYKKMTDRLHSSFQATNNMTFLTYLYTEPLSKQAKSEVSLQLVDLFIREKRYKEAFLFLSQQTDPLQSEQVDLLLFTLHHLDTVSFEQFTAKTLLHSHADLSQIKKAIDCLIPKLLHQHDITYSYNWLKPFMHLSLPAILKIKKMQEMKEEPDRQRELGELYYEFDQVPHAIECFLWHLEMEENDLKTMKWLIKLYKELGQEDEAISYQYLYKQMQKTS